MNARRIGVLAVSIAIVYVLVRVVQIPTVAAGFIHLGTIAEIFVAMAFGPVVGLIASAVGATLVDLTTGFVNFAPLTLIAHGALGFLAGYLGWKKSSGRMIVAWIVGGLALVAIYFVGETVVVSVYGGLPRAVGELVPNLVQVGTGLLGLVLFKLVKRAYPQIEQLGGDITFEEA